MSAEEDLARRVLYACRRRGLRLATAESCTGGLIAAALTEIPGSSDVVDRGFVTYSNVAKQEMLGVLASTLDLFGAVSSQTAADMATGAVAGSHAGVAVSVTGIAGPAGGSADKPVGLVWFGVAVAGEPVVTHKREFEDKGRSFIRREAVATALKLVIEALGQDGRAAAP